MARMVASRRSSMTMCPEAPTSTSSTPGIRRATSSKSGFSKTRSWWPRIVIVGTLSLGNRSQPFQRARFSWYQDFKVGGGAPSQLRVKREASCRVVNGRRSSRR